MTAFTFKDLGPNKSTTVDKEIGATYFVSKKLGSGACGVVRLVYDKITCQEYAMKHVKKNCLVETNLTKSINEEERVMNEVRIMKSMDHVSSISYTFINFINIYFINLYGFRLPEYLTLDMFYHFNG